MNEQLYHPSKGPFVGSKRELRSKSKQHLIPKLAPRTQKPSNEKGF
jgi:hypothetical protein